MFSRFGFLAALLLVMLPVAAAPPMTIIKVELKTLSGKPVDRASVIVDFVQGRSVVKLGRKNKFHWEVRSNQEGLAKIPAIPQGKIRIQVNAKGFQTFGEIFDVEEEQKTIAIRLNPPQAQHSEHQ